MHKKIKGIALLQALFFMMFIMAAISVAMMMSVQHKTSVSGERIAVDAYPAISAMLAYAKTSTDKTIYGSTYFSDHPLSQTYLDQLSADGLSDPSNITITIS